MPGLQCRVWQPDGSSSSFVSRRDFWGERWWIWSYFFPVFRVTERIMESIFFNCYRLHI